MIRAGIIGATGYAGAELVRARSWSASSRGIRTWKSSGTAPEAT